MNEFEDAINKTFDKLMAMPEDEFKTLIKENMNAPLAKLIQYAMEPEKFIESNKIDLAEVITKYGTGKFQDFEGFTEEKELNLIKKSIMKHSKIFDHYGPEFEQILCDITLIKIIARLNEGEGTVTDDEIFDYMIFLEDLVSCRYLLKSNIDWRKVKE